ncbi:hypothetical protein CHN50_18165 [Priestia aryabhattai]|nr:hypothetical protein CHN50_18165 [Priestia aryabhattai]
MPAINDKFSNIIDISLKSLQLIKSQITPEQVVLTLVLFVIFKDLFNLKKSLRLYFFKFNQY